MIINRVIEENENDDREKKYPQQYFILDFRYMILANKIRDEL